MNSRCILAGVFALTVLFTAAQAQYTEVVPQWTTEDDSNITVNRTLDPDIRRSFKEIVE
jgi:uncharacterized membrane protein